jgi:hypothetical protein
MCVTLVASVLFACYQLYETWTALNVWKGAREAQGLNPFQLVANYSQMGHKQVREASQRLQEAAEGSVMLGKSTDEKERKVGEGPKGDGLKKEPKIILGKDPIKEFMATEKSKSSMNFKDIAKSMLPERDSAGLDPDAAKYAAKKQAKISKKSVVRRKEDTASSYADPDFENVDLKKLKGQKK